MTDKMWKNWYVQPTKPEKRRKNYRGGVLVAALLLLLSLPGCGYGSYEKITTAQTAENGAGQSENRKEEAGTEKDYGENTAAEIVLETEAADAGAARGENPDGAQANNPGGDQERNPGELPENLVGKAAEFSEDSGASMSILFSGDVLLSDHVLNAYSRAGGISGVLDQNYRNAIQSVDYFAVNEEFPFSSRGTQAADKQYTFRLAPEKVSLFQEMGIDAVTLANNHALDYGVDALLDTCEVLDGAGILHTGAGKDLNAAKQPVVFEKNGQKVALIGATRVIPEAGWAATNGHPGMLSSYEVSVEPLLQQIASCHADGEKVVVLIHWGIERDEKPQEYQRALAKRYIDAGADLVIGSHPHVLQGIEYYKGKPIFYSLGNFVFGSSIPKTMLVQVEFQGENLSLRLLPGTSSGGYTRMLTDSGEMTQFYQYLESISFGVSIGADGAVSAQP